MKFTDGNWLMREGVRAYYPAEAHDVAATDGSMTIYAPTHPIRHRGDTLAGPVLTVELSSPLRNVIRVRVGHFAGVRDHRPSFAVSLDRSDGSGASDMSDVSDLVFRSGALSARVAREGGWSLRFEADGRLVTSSAPRGMGYALVDGEGAYLHEGLSLGVGECVYGLGERFTAFVKNGQVVEMWNRDGGTGSDQAYKNVPFYLTNRGYGVFVNHPGRVEFEVASEKVSRVQFSAAGESLEYYVIYGPTPGEVLERCTALTGRPALPPAWSFGLWLTTSFTTSYDEETVTSFIQGMADRDLPLHVFHFDCFWMRGFHWCDFEWDPAVFPDPPAMLARLKERGLRICAWINPYIAQRSALFEEGRSAGYLLKRPNGDVWQWDLWQPGMGIVDFTNPGACEWYAGKLRALMAMGVDCFKTDFGERIPTDVVWHDGSDPERMHNYYAVLYNKVVFEAIEAERGKGDAVVFARSATAGGQQYPVHWGGDCHSTFESMAESLRGGLSLCLSGFGFWSHDIGGFEGTPPADVYKRWIAFGLLSSHSRLHGSSSYRVPWLFDDEAVDTLRFFTKLKCRLMPYLYGAAVEAHRTGMPVMRAMVLEFPGDPACDTLDRQYMLGPSLLIAPVFTPEGDVEFYVPEGRWTSLIDGSVIEGPRWVRQTHGFLSLPLLVRPNALIALGARDDRPDYDFAEGVTLRLYEPVDGGECRATIPALDGSDRLTVRASRTGGTLRIEADGDARWRCLLVGTAAVAAVSGASWSKKPDGVLLTSRSGSRVVEACLA